MYALAKFALVWITCYKLKLFNFRHGHLEVVKYLADNSNCDINATDGSGWTPLHFACQ